MQPVRITEIFYSISGEGISQGIPTLFIRFAGCSLRCGKTNEQKLWCDTPYSLSPVAGEIYSLDKVLEIIEAYSNPPVQILLTGGEPLEGEEKREFCKILSEIVYKKRHNSYNYPGVFEFSRIETNGKENISGLENMVFSLDYKLPGSGMEDQMNQDNFDYIRERNHPLDEVKFVVRDKKDFDRALEVTTTFKLKNNLIFSPVQEDCRPENLAEWIKESKISGARLSLQIHKILWGNKRGV